MDPGNLILVSILRDSDAVSGGDGEMTSDEDTELVDKEVASVPDTV